MSLPSRETLRRLGNGENIAAVCEDAGITRGQFDVWWKAECASRVPAATGSQLAAVRQGVRILRDRWGIPHILAQNDDDLFFGFGHAMASDRLFQLDFLRRRGAGRLAEILGPDGTGLDALARTTGLRNILELDILARSVGLTHIAEKEWAQLSAEPRRLIEAFCAGINSVIDATKDRPPIEFDLLDYRPEPWSPVDCLIVENEFRWYLTGRFPVIVIPELARRTLGSGPLFRAFLQGENDEESIVPPGSYPATRLGTQPIGMAVSDPQAAEGSNNWVVSGRHTASGVSMVASDPHIAFDAVSCWYEVHLHGGSFNVAGMAYVGMPAVLFGRNEYVAWGCTNNICSQRDLYQEKTDPHHPNCYLFDGRWEPATVRIETIQVRGGAPVRQTIRCSRNGPIVDEILPPPARTTSPVSLKWLGAQHGGWLTALLGINRAGSVGEFRRATQPWHVPTFSVVFADDQGHIGFQNVGRIPIRKVWERGYRPGWDPAHQWDGLIPFDGMPHLADPERGWVITANNRPAPDDFPYPLSGTWGDGLRATRIRERLQEKSAHSRADFTAIHQDALSVRARTVLPGLLQAIDAIRDAGGVLIREGEAPAEPASLAPAEQRKQAPAEPASLARQEPRPPKTGHYQDIRVQQAARLLRDWDCHMEPDRVGAAIFTVFFGHWVKAVVNERFEGETAALLAGGANGLAASLLQHDAQGWFQPAQREQAIVSAMRAALSSLEQRLGTDMNHWTWGRIHTLPLRHVLSGRGDLAQLLDHGGVPVKGDATTVCNTGLGGNLEARSGAGYRLIAEVNTRPIGLWAVDGQSQSGHPGSPHYDDQLYDWLEGRYHFIPMSDVEVISSAVSEMRLDAMKGQL